MQIQFPLVASVREAGGVVMGKTVTGHVDVEDNQVVFDIDLPMALSFVEPMIRGVIAEKGQKLLK